MRNSRSKRAMIQQARTLHRHIYPAGKKVRLDDCFTDEGDKVYFWFNTADRSTHVLERSKRLPKQ